MNFVHVAGHLGADPEVRFTSTGKKVTTLRVAARTRKGQNEDTIWWRVTVWGEQYDKMMAYLKKGSAVVVVGELHKPEIFSDKEGKPQISMEITAYHLQFSPFGKSPNSPSAQQAGQEGQGSQNQLSSVNSASPFGHFKEESPNPYMSGYPSPAAGKGSTFDDEVPF